MADIVKHVAVDDDCETPKPHDRYNHVDPSASEPHPGSKRLFSSRHPAHDDTEDLENGDNFFSDEVEHSGKRHRTTDWPLKSTADSQRSPLRARPNDPNRGSNARRTTSLTRPSKFLEGSMNDRTSQKPPTEYLGDDELIQLQFEQEQLASRINQARARSKQRLAKLPNRTTGVQKADTSNRSSIFRFGKSLAATFNPSNWNIWSKSQEPENDNQDDARARANAVYKEMVKTGQFRDSTHAPYKHIDTRASATLQRGPDSPEKHDSGVQFGSDDLGLESAGLKLDGVNQPTPEQLKRFGRVFLETPSLLATLEADAESIRTEESSTPVSLLDAQRDYALENERRPKSTQILGLPEETPSSALNAKRSIFLKLPLGGSATQMNHKTDGVSDSPQSFRKIPSRRDLQKQRKLANRISDLEAKLIAARRELSATIGESVDNSVRGSKFLSGILPTLQSEGLLSAGVHHDESNGVMHSVEDIGVAVSADAPISTRNLLLENKQPRTSLQTPVDKKPLPDKPLPCSPKNEAEEMKEDAKCFEDRLPVDPATPLRKKPRVHGLNAADSDLESSPSKPNSRKRKGFEAKIDGDGDDEYEYESGDEATSSATKRERKIVLLKAGQQNLSKFPAGESAPSVSEQGYLAHDYDIELAETECVGQPKQRGRPRKVQKIDQGLIPPTGSRSTKPSRIPLKQKSNESGSGSLSQDEADEPAPEESAAASIPPVPELPNSVRLPSGEVVNLRMFSGSSFVMPDYTAVNRKGLPMCTACDQEFSSFGRLKTHIDKFCKFLKAEGMYEPGANKISFERHNMMQKMGREESQEFDWARDTF